MVFLFLVRVLIRRRGAAAAAEATASSSVGFVVSLGLLDCGLDVRAFLTSSAGAVDCVVRALLLSSSSAVDCGAVCAVGVTIGVFRIVLWLLLSSCAVDFVGGVCAVVDIFVGGIGLYVLAFLSVVAVVGLASSLTSLLLSSSVSGRCIILRV